jgi:hypothetical protein
MIEEAIITRLRAVSGVTALLGSGSALRIYLGLMPQAPTYPAGTYTRISTVRESAMGADPGLAHGRFQFDIYDTDPTSVRDTLNAVRAALQRWRGTDTTNGTTVIQDSFIDNEIWMAPELVDSVPVFRASMDVMFHFTE